MFVIGTAGHVDHGKSSLVRALTGIDPDRLPEEKEREMTIDLGFAWLLLDDGQEVGIVDVPGHERFIKNMIAGAGAVNAVLFVVAADDGWMPQSQEHLDILEFLQIKNGIVVLTKIELVEKDWLNLVEQEMRKKVKNSFLKDAPLIRVSSTTQTGIGELKREIKIMLSKMSPPVDVGKPRLFIDRVFTMAGRGTVVTGTLTDGKFKQNQEVEILPHGLKNRIREIQTHKKSLAEARPGNRVALNLSGLEKQALQRGDVVVSSNQDETALSLYIKLKLLPQIEWSLKKPVLLQVMSGSAEVLGNAVLLDKKELGPGDSGLVELRLKEPLVPRIGDRVILRLPGPQLTIGGGPILDWSSTNRDCPRKERISTLQKRLDLNLSGLILTEVEKKGYARQAELLKSSHFSVEEIFEGTESLIQGGQLIRLQNGFCTASIWSRLQDKLLDELKKYHQAYPHKIGLKAQELAVRLKAELELVQLLIDELLSEGKLLEKQGYLALSAHQPSLPDTLQKKLQFLSKKIESAPFSPPSREDLVKEDPDCELIITYLIQNEELLELRDGLLFRTSDFRAVEQKVKELIQRKGQVSVAEVRESLATSRKYAVPILEKLDQMGVTKRKGDYRILNDKN